MSVTTSTSFGTGWNEWFCPVNFILAYVFKSANPQLTGYNDGLFQSLMSPENMAAAPIVDPASIGKSNQIRLGYRRRNAEISEVAMVACDTAVETPLYELNFALNKYSSGKWKISFETMQMFCNEFSEAFPAINTILRRELGAGGEITGLNNLNNVLRSPNALTELVRMMPGTFANIHDLIMVQNAIRHNINKQLVTEMYLSFIGDFAGPSPVASPYAVALITAANGSLVNKGFQNMWHEYRKAMRQGTPILVGFNLLQKALSSMTDYCCNLTGSELDPMRTASGIGMKFYADQHVNQVALGATSTESFIMYAPGSMAVYFRNNYKEPYTLNGVHRGVIADLELPGVEYDYIVKEDGCDNSITFQLGTQFGLWAFRPADTYNVGDDLVNVNGVFELTAVEV